MSYRSFEDGCANDWHLMHLGQYSMGAGGLVITEANHVSPEGRISPKCLGLYSDENEAAIKRVVDFCKRYGVTAMGTQLGHAGRKASTHPPLDGGASLTVTNHLFSCLTAWLAPILCFTMEEAWLERNAGEDTSVHLRQFPDVPEGWRDDALAEKWRKIRQVRRVVTGALEIERQEKRIGSSLEAAPEIFISDEALFESIKAYDWAEIAITSQATLTKGEGPGDAFRLDEVPGVSVVPKMAEGNKCARSWKILPEVGSDADFPDLTPRDAEAVRQFDARRQAAE